MADLAPPAPPVSAPAAAGSSLFSGLTSLVPPGASSFFSGLSSLFSGGPGLTLGGFTFQGFEVPDTVNIGAEMRIVRHQYVGGALTLDVLGPVTDDITWKGRFQGPGAKQRYLALCAIRDAGKAVALSFGTFALTVVVKVVRIDYEQEYQILYHFAAVPVVPKPVGAAGTAASSTSALGSISSDIGKALGISGLADTLSSSLGDVQSAVSQVQKVVGVAGALGLPVAGLQAKLGMAGTITGGLSSVANGNILSGAAALSAATGIGGKGAAAALTNLSSAASQASNTAVVQNLLNRAATNVHQLVQP